MCPDSDSLKKNYETESNFEDLFQKMAISSFPLKMRNAILIPTQLYSMENIQFEAVFENAWSNCHFIGYINALNAIHLK